ncbi:hypothetical protein AKO1_012058 [Acrasis kona]|uniref:Thioredoxin domain-containing protein n=1 Tax=Acrasis kona TaxID=1008807 RepID=A0AAW2ZCH3_9EUKA
MFKFASKVPRVAFATTKLSRVAVALRSVVVVAPQIRSFHKNNVYNFSKTTILRQEGSQLIVDVTAENFNEEVIKSPVPVILDFYADWCGPCKKLTPLLEQEVKNAEGSIKLVKINTDQQPTLAQEFGVSSLPMVFVFMNKNFAKVFQGAQSEQTVKELVKKLIEVGGGGKIVTSQTEAANTPQTPDQLYRQARQLMAGGQIEPATEILAGILGENGSEEDRKTLHPKVYSALVICALKNKDFGAAKQMIDAVGEIAKQHPNVLNEPDVSTTNSIFEVYKTLGEEYLKETEQQKSDRMQELIQTVSPDAPNYDSQLQMASRYFLENEHQKAVDQCLQLLRKRVGYDKEKAEEAKKLLILFFNSLGPDSDVTKSGRRKMASLMF